MVFDENGDRVHGTRTAKDWANRLSKLMSDEEFRAFVEFYDACDGIDFFEKLVAIDAERHPEDYSNEAEGEDVEYC